MAAVLTSGPATAGECARTYFVDTYKAAVAKKDHAGIRRLAEEGFAPAQRRVGEVLLATPDTRIEGLGWVRLAVGAGDPLASEVLMDAQPSLPELDQAARFVAAWKPTPVACMQGFFDRVRSDNRVTVGEFADQLTVGDVSHAKDQVGLRALRVLFQVAESTPGMLPYVRSLGAVHVRRQPITSYAHRSEQGATVLIDEGMLMDPAKARLPAFAATVLQAIRTAVHDRVEPPNFLKAEYKGRSITAVGHRDAHEAMKQIKQGIDLAEALPSDLRKLAVLPKKLHYEAPQAGVDVRASGSYDGKIHVVWFKRNPRNISAREVAASLAANGVYVTRLAKGDTPGLDAQREADRVSRLARDILR